MTNDDHPRVVCLGVDPSGGRMDASGFAVAAVYDHGRYELLSVTTKRTPFTGLRKAVEQRLTEIVAAFPNSLLALCLDATGTQGGVAAMAEELIEKNWPDRQIRVLPVTLTGGDGLGKRLARIAGTSNPVCYSISRTAVVNRVYYGLNDGTINPLELPDADKLILRPEMLGWFEKNGRVDHGAAGDNALWAVGTAVVGAEFAAGHLAALSAPSPNRRIGQSHGGMGTPFERYSQKARADLASRDLGKCGL